MTFQSSPKKKLDKTYLSVYSLLIISWKKGEDKKTMMKRVNFTISEVEVNWLKVLSKKTGLSASEIVRRAIDDYWERFEKKEKRR